MTAPECRACPMPDQIAALELVRLREGIGRLASEIEGRAQRADSAARLWRSPYDGGRATAHEHDAEQLRSLLDDNQGER